MKLSFARAISFLFNPLVVTAGAPFFLVYKSSHDVMLSIYWTAYTLSYLLFIGLVVLIGVRKKFFTDLDISKREQRPVMFLLCIILAVIYLASLFFFHGPFILFVLAIGVILGISFVSVINRTIKASIHVATITALIVAVAVSYSNYYLLLLIPLVAWSRLKTKRHTFSEIVVGGTIGSILSLSMYLAVKFFFQKYV